MAPLLILLICMFYKKNEQVMALFSHCIMACTELVSSGHKNLLVLRDGAMFQQESSCVMLHLDALRRMD